MATVQPEDEVYKPRRPRSPIQRILRYRLNDPELTSLNDVRFRPYTAETKSFNRNRSRQQGKDSKITGQLGSNNINDNNQNHHTSSGSKTNTANLQKVDQAFHTNNNALNLKTHKYFPSPSDKEMQFSNRCQELGVAFGWYKQKKTTDGEELENIAIEMVYANKSFKIYGGFCDPTFAREVAFQEGLRRLEFLFGKPGEHTKGFLNNPKQCLNGEIDKSIIPNVFPNPFHAEARWAPPLPSYPQALLPPPPPPNYPPPSLPPPNYPPPSLPPPNYPPPLPPSNYPRSISTQVPLNRKTYAQPIPPGISSESELREMFNDFGVGSYHLPFLEHYASLNSKLPETPSDQHLEVQNCKSDTEMPNNENGILGYTSVFETSGSLVAKSQSCLDVGQSGTTYETSETQFYNKLMSKNLFYRCNELPVENKDGINYYAFEIEMREKGTQVLRDKLEGAKMTEINMARENAFTVALAKLDSLYPSGNAEEEIIQDFGPGIPVWDISGNSVEISEFWKTAYSNLPEAAQGRGMGRGLIRKSDGQHLPDNHRGYWSVTNCNLNRS